MTITEAMRIKDEFYEKNNPSEDDVFLFTEAMQFLIEETKDPNHMMHLGGYYYGIRQFDLALKYYELAAEYKLTEAYECLGYIWYYGRTGEKNYEKAFKYFSKAKDAGDLIAAYKVADMYKNGYYVERDYEKYKAIIEELYPKVRRANYLGDPLPEVFTRLARIRAEEGKPEEAVTLYLQAKDFLAQRISYNDFFGDLNIMKWLIDDLYELTSFDKENFDFYDLYYLLKSPCKVSFEFDDKPYEVAALEEDGNTVIQFNGSWYRTRDDFFQKATLEDDKLTYLYDQLWDFEVKE